MIEKEMMKIMKKRENINRKIRKREIKIKVIEKEMMKIKKKREKINRKIRKQEIKSDIKRND